MEREAGRVSVGRAKQSSTVSTHNEEDNKFQNYGGYNKKKNQMTTK
jgi:hypothetical protein